MPICCYCFLCRDIAICCYRFICGDVAIVNDPISQRFSDLLCTGLGPIGASLTRYDNPA